MLKVLIADDEPKIRRGLKNSINWSKLDIEVAGEAEDGEIALSMAERIKPDILLVDICMPFINGLEFIAKLKDILPDSIVIVITGHDEFAYAQQSIKLKVFDYLLKPVEKEQLFAVVGKAKDELIQLRQKNKYISWAEQQLKKNFPLLKERFLNEWVNGNISEPEALEQLEFYKAGINQDSGMLLIKLIERYNAGETSKEWDRQRILFAVQNIVSELVRNSSPHVIFRDHKDNIVVIVPITHVSFWNELSGKIGAMTEQYLKQMVITVQQKIDGGILYAPVVYKRLAADITKEENWTPVVMLSKNYIDANYSREDLTLQDVADAFKISPAYLSRLLRQELGVSFIDYLTQVRINKAISLMDDPFIKMYEVAEKVGYSSQHYFSTAFKRVIGVSPATYHKGGMR
ncbi:MAG TPA: response regulator [Clostridia bacterium]|nr:response regulator [Clostridia bacterium]